MVRASSSFAFACALGLAVQASFLLSPCRAFSTAGSIAPTTRTQGRFATSSSPLQSQILDYMEPTTGTPVKLIGAMHYNPASIKLATDAIEELQSQGKLGSIIIESCDIRWNATLENEMVKESLMSEMRAAHDLGLKYDRPVVLGDQRINITVDALKSGAKEAVLDLVQPWNGGWNRLFDSISAARKEAVPIGEGYLGLESFFDPKLLTAAPVSMIKYPLSYAVKSPMFAVAVGALIVLGGVEDSSAIIGVDDMTATDLLESLFLSALETVIFARIFLKELLAERNEVLADSILQQCRNYQQVKSGNEGGWLDKLFGQAGGERGDGDKASGAVYAPGSVVGKPEDGTKTVVAVLGLAHCNGIKKLMTE